MSDAKTANKATAKKKETATPKKAVKRLPPTAESRIKRAETFNRMSERFRKLTQKKDELDAFQVGSDDLNETLVLSAGQTSFSVSNSIVINKLKLVIEEELCGMIEASEKELLNFEI